MPLSTLYTPCDRSDGLRSPAPTNDLLKLAAASAAGRVLLCCIGLQRRRSLPVGSTLARPWPRLRTLAFLSLMLLLLRALPMHPTASNMHVYYANGLHHLYTVIVNNELFH